MSGMWLTALGAAWATMIGAQPQETPPRPTPAPPAQNAPASPPAPGLPDGRIRTADDLLLALEHADSNLSTLTADIVYDRSKPFEGYQQTRSGKLYFRTAPADAGEDRGGRKFGVRFDKLIQDGQVFEEPKYFIFDGQWLVEKMPKERQFIKRQVVPPGEDFDPLRIGEGPFPIPIGQRREEILERYNAELLPPEAGLDPENSTERTAIEFTRGTYQLRLTPRPEAAAESEFDEVRLWYRPTEDGGLLPHLARTVKGGEGVEDISLVILRNVETNVPIPDEALDTSTPRGNWMVDVRDWDGRAGG